MNTRIIVLLAVTACLATTQGVAARKQPSASTVFSVVVQSPSLTVLEKALIKTGLDAVLKNPNFAGTVFAPTDRAFAKLLKALKLTEAQLLALPTLKNILSYHVVPVKALSKNLKEGQVLSTLLPRQNLKVEFETISLNWFRVLTLLEIEANKSDAFVVQADVQPTSKAVIHVVDTVLLP